MDLKNLQDKLAQEYLTAADPDDPLKGLTPAEAEAKAEEILEAALDAQEQLANLRSQLAPVLKLAKALGVSRRFLQMVQQVDAEMAQIGALYVRVAEAKGHWRKGTQDQLIAVILETNPELEDLLNQAKEKAKTFNQGSAKVKVWDKKPTDKRKKAPFEVKLASDHVAALDKDAGIWSVLKNALKALRGLSDQAVEWMRSLFATLYEPYFENLYDTLRDTRRELEAAVEAAE